MKMSTKQDFLQKLEDELNAWDAELDELKAKARSAKVEIRTEAPIRG